MNNGVQVVSTRQVCLRPARTTMKSYQRFNRAFQRDKLPQALNALQLTDIDLETWLPNYRALAYMSCNNSNSLYLQKYIGSNQL